MTFALGLLDRVRALLTERTTVAVTAQKDASPKLYVPTMQDQLNEAVRRSPPEVVFRDSDPRDGILGRALASVGDSHRAEVLGQNIVADTGSRRFQASQTTSPSPFREVPSNPKGDRYSSAGTRLTDVLAWDTTQPVRTTLRPGSTNEGRAEVR